MLKIRFMNCDYTQVETNYYGRKYIVDKELLEQYAAMKRLIIALGGTIYGGWTPRYNGFTNDIVLGGWDSYSGIRPCYEWDDYGGIQEEIEGHYEIYFELICDLTKEKVEYMKQFTRKFDRITFKPTLIREVP